MVNGLAVELRGLRKAYKDVVAVNGLDLEVRPGECFGLLGPNGAGKTTTIEICEGLTTPDAGEVRVLGRDWATGGGALRERLGISLQETQFSDKLTVSETLRLFRSFYRRPRPLADVLDAVQLGEKRNGRVGQLSGGQKQRLALACALVADPELFFLDEPTTGLDPQSRRQLWDLIEGVQRAGRTVVLTTHYMEEAERLCDRVAIVDHGKVIAAGSPRELVAGLGAQHVVEFSLGSPPSPGGPTDRPTVSDAELLALDGAVSVRRTEDRCQVESTHAHRTIPALLALLSARGLPLAELSTHSASLEDVFVHLTGRQLRDA
ncbi:MAG TPA: ABC transporter ATP-binding protein [Gemmatimonadales bacterium]|jgi:ABC-2 type transport system ATP-binding protein|nr:ABC transporter ATP-binding protein [Gemmatimonadales bacterium]